MESFYRMMRKRHDVLLDGAGQPEGGKWNYDANNRKKLAQRPRSSVSLLWEREVSSVLEDLEVGRGADGRAGGCCAVWVASDSVKRAMNCWTSLWRSCCRGLGIFKTRSPRTVGRCTTAD